MVTAPASPNSHKFQHSEIFTQFTLSTEIIKSLDKYYLLHWSGSFFSDLWYKEAGRFNHQDSRYSIIWFPHQTVSEILSAKQVALSFRRTRGFSEGYVMVKALAPSQPGVK